MLPYEDLAGLPVRYYNTKDMEKAVKEYNNKLYYSITNILPEKPKKLSIDLDML